ARVEKWLKAALTKEPTSKRLRLALSDLYNTQERYSEVIALYKQLLKENDRELLVLNNLAFLLTFSQGDTKEALELVNRAITAVGPTPELLDTRALIYLKKGQNKEAVEDLNNALAQAPGASRYFHLARAYLLTGNRTAALVALARAKALGLKVGDMHALE